MELGGDNRVGGGEKFVADGYRRFVGSLREISVGKFNARHRTENRSILIILALIDLHKLFDFI